MKAVSLDDSSLSLTLSKQTCCLQSGGGHVALGLPNCAHGHLLIHALKRVQFVNMAFRNEDLLK